MSEREIIEKVAEIEARLLQPVGDAFARLNAQFVDREWAEAVAAARAGAEIRVEPGTIRPSSPSS